MLWPRPTPLTGRIIIPCCVDLLGLRHNYLYIIYTLSAPEVVTESTALPLPPSYNPTPLPTLLPYIHEKLIWNQFFASASNEPYPSNCTEHYPPSPFTDNLSVSLARPLTKAFNTGRMSGTGISITYQEVQLPHSSAGIQSQCRNFAIGMTSGINQRLVSIATMPAAMPVFAPIPEPRDQSLAPNLNPPKAFTGVRTEYQAFVLQLNLILNSDLYRYQGDATRISYATSFLSRSALEGFSPYVSDKGVIEFKTWHDFITAFAPDGTPP